MIEEGIYKFKFSIIMSIYNVEKYLKEAIDSIINQDIGFEENVQLILVNDGSPDNSEKICLKYKEKYPNNVVYVKKENGGVSTAKNLGLTYRKGKYINFFDPDDVLSSNTLSEVYKFFENNYNTISMVAIPLQFFEARTDLHPKYMYMEDKNRIINLDEEPYNFVLSTAASFYITEIFDNNKFDENMKQEEDTKLNCKIYEKDHCLGYVCENGVQYNYRRRMDGNSAVDNSLIDNKTFYAVINLLDEILEGKTKDNIPNYLKELILYETRSRLKQLDEQIIGKKEYQYIIEKYREYIRLIGNEYIATSTKWLDKLKEKYFYLSNFLQDKNILTLSENGFIKYKDINLLPVNKLNLSIQNIKFY